MQETQEIKVPVFVAIHTQSKAHYQVGKDITRMADGTIIPEDTRMARKLRSFEKDFKLALETGKEDLIEAHADRFTLLTTDGKVAETLAKAFEGAMRDKLKADHEAAKAARRSERKRENKREKRNQK